MFKSHRALNKLALIGNQIASAGTSADGCSSMTGSGPRNYRVEKYI